MVLAGGSDFLRALIQQSQSCECDSLTLYLPDYKASTVKNLLSILYTGRESVFESGRSM